MNQGHSVLFVFWEKVSNCSCSNSESSCLVLSSAGSQHVTLFIYLLLLVYLFPYFYKVSCSPGWPLCSWASLELLISQPPVPRCWDYSDTIPLSYYFLNCSFGLFTMSSHILPQAGLKHKVRLLPQHPKFWDYQQESSHTVPSVRLEWQVKLDCIHSVIPLLWEKRCHICGNLSLSRDKIYGLPWGFYLFLKCIYLFIIWCVDTPWVPGLLSGVRLPSFLSTLSEAESSFPMHTHQAGLELLERMSSTSSLTTSVLRLQMCAKGAGDLNSSPHICVGSASPKEPSPQPHFHIKGLSHLQMWLGDRANMYGPGLDLSTANNKE